MVLGGAVRVRRIPTSPTIVESTSPQKSIDNDEENNNNNNNNFINSPIKHISKSPSRRKSDIIANINTPEKNNNRCSSIISMGAFRPEINNNIVNSNEITLLDDDNDNNLQKRRFSSLLQEQDDIKQSSNKILLSSRRSSSSSIGSIGDINSGRNSATEEELKQRPWNIEDFSLGKPLGRGKFGNVYLAKQKLTSVTCALKVLFKSQMQAANCVNMLRREVEIQCRMKHDNIVPLFGYFHDIKKLYLILEYQQQGELFKHIAKLGGYVDEETCKKYMKDVASAVSYMHSHFIIHRDLKPENILISDNGKLKIADFGWAVHSPTPFIPRLTMCGTPEYFAPEMISGKGHHLEVDLWALGIFMYELLFGRTPFLEKVIPISNDSLDIELTAELLARNTLYEKISSHNGVLKFPNDLGNIKLTKEMEIIINNLLLPDPINRLKAKDLLNSDWILYN